MILCFCCGVKAFEAITAVLMGAYQLFSNQTWIALSGPETAIT
jgi:hypothetical protein